MPFREKRPDEQVFSQLVPLSRPVCRADWRKSARLFAYRPGVHCRDGLTAGGDRIRTIGTRKIGYRLETDFCRPRDCFPKGVHFFRGGEP